MSGYRRHTLIAAALIRQGDDVLLVQQQGQGDSEPYWALPGGVGEPGELPHETMVREIREETGLEILDPGRLLYVKSSVDPSVDSSGTTFVFETDDWRGELRPADPDEAILDARFIAVEEALEKLRRLPWEMMREPIIAHLSGALEAGALWLYHHHPDGSAELVGTLPNVTPDTKLR